MLLFRQGNLTEKQVFLLQSVQWRRQLDGGLVIIIGNSASAGRHAQIEIDLLFLVIRPWASIIVMVVAPALILIQRVIYLIRHLSFKYSVSE